MMRVVLFVAVVACAPRSIPPGTPDQSVRDAMVLVCDAPKRAAGEGGSRADAIAGHLTDGVGNVEVLTTVEAWKTDGIDKAELARLVERAGLKRCALQQE